jgi:hypothetical protein
MLMLMLVLTADPDLLRHSGPSHLPHLALYYTIEFRENKMWKTSGQK